MKNYFIYISPVDEFDKLNYEGQHLAARLGRGFQTRPAESWAPNCLKKVTKLSRNLSLNNCLKNHKAGFSAAGLTCSHSKH